MWRWAADLLIPPKALDWTSHRHRWTDTWRPTHRGAHTVHLHVLRHRRNHVPRKAG